MAQKSQLPPKATQAECPLPGAFTSQQQREELAQSNFSEQSLAPAPRMSVQRGPSHVLGCHSHWLLQHSPGLPLMPPLEPGHPRRCTRCEEEGGGRRSPALCPYGCWSLWDGSLNATQSQIWEGPVSISEADHSQQAYSITMHRSPNSLWVPYSIPLCLLIQSTKNPSLRHTCAGHSECPRERDPCSPCSPRAHR